MSERLTTEKLVKILESHGKWLRDEEGEERADLRDANLIGADLRSANLRCADLSNANLSDADLSSANLRGADLSYADLSSANLRYADLSGADLCYADLSSADLSNADLRCADLHCADLSGANLSNADLSSADLSNADLHYAALSNANLRDVDLSNANLRYADLRGVENLQTACVWDTNLSSTKLDGRWVVIAQIGSRKGTTYYDKENDILRCGCFKGDLAEFEEAVEQTHGDHPQYLAEYRAAIAYIKAICEIEEEFKNDCTV